MGCFNYVAVEKIGWQNFDCLFVCLFLFSFADISLKDWDVQEQENLREVEKILDRTDEILEVRQAQFG